MGAIAGWIQVTGLQAQSLQGDKKILQALASAGAGISQQADDVKVWKDRLLAFEFDARDCPDLFPPLAVLASQCGGVSKISGVGRLKHKESDRAQVLIQILTRLGIQVRVKGDHMWIQGGRITGGEIETFDDHRMAMAAAVAGLVSGEGVKIRDWRCVFKSYPGFFQDLEFLGGNIR